MRLWLLQGILPHMNGLKRCSGLLVPFRARHLFTATLNDLKQAGLIDGSATEVPPIPTDYDAKFNQWTDAILKVAETQPESQVNGPLRRDNPVLRMAVAQFRGVKKPQATLSEAVEHYLSQKITTFNERDLRKQVGLVQKLLSEVSGTADPRLDEITLDVAEAFRERMLAAGNSPATVKRRITTIKAVLNRFIKDKRLKPEVENYFNGLEVRDVGGPADRDRGDALGTPVDGFVWYGFVFEATATKSSHTHNRSRVKRFTFRIQVPNLIKGKMPGDQGIV